VQHLPFFDYVAITGKKEDRAIEFVDHLHEHYLDPVKIENGRYWPTDVPGNSQQMHKASIESFVFPDGPEWSS
jgi:L-fuconate dehydratase